MKKVFLFLFYLSVLYSCDGDYKTQNNSFKNKNSVNNDTLNNKTIDNDKNKSISPKIIIDDTIANTHGITPLPFGPPIENVNNLCEVSSDFYYKLIGDNIQKDNPNYTDTYLLPRINKLKYSIIDTLYESTTCSTNVPVDSLLKISKFKYRLPDFGPFEVYYMSDDSRKSDDFSPSFRRYCENFLFNYYGYLILYNKKIKEANVLNIFYSTYRDALNTRFFYIDSDYSIYVCNSQFSEGLGETEKSIGPLYKILILKNGSFEIKKIFDHK